jgi:hypothetical protein
VLHEHEQARYLQHQVVKAGTHASEVLHEVTAPQQPQQLATATLQLLAPALRPQEEGNTGTVALLPHSPPLCPHTGSSASRRPGSGWSWPGCWPHRGQQPQ